ncbi:hypothetical protein SDC9_206902 [bioreactor metagenome]|uniref:Uncharacterized protein n=1 Tax=bioreactor metagenome TaxID=1076179 RepID=A0A645J7S3_9ZZZZ
MERAISFQREICAPSGGKGENGIALRGRYGRTPPISTRQDGLFRRLLNKDKACAVEVHDVHPALFVVAVPEDLAACDIGLIKPLRRIHKYGVASVGIAAVIP